MVTTTPVLVDVAITRRTDEIGGFDVDPVWSGVDRPNTGGWNVKDAKMAARLERALRAGVAVTVTGVLTDVDGNTYVGTRRHVMGKYMNADLRRLGF